MIVLITDDKPRIWKCQATRLWLCIKNGVLGRGTTMKGAHTKMRERHLRIYGEPA